MPIFIGVNLALCFFIQTTNFSQSILETRLVMYVALGIATASFVAMLYQKWRRLIWYDLFSSALVLVWFVYWKPFFRDDSPIFFIFPLYFFMFAAFASLFFIGSRHRIDTVSLSIMKDLDKKNIMQPALIMLCVFLSLALEEYFMLYPTMMTLLIIRFSLASCVAVRGG
ncbi:MAG: hypothetical protein NTU70_01355 [Methylococcales bacterium]|jgi:hypothetical protein|nr:hypothetical protein [Methylococcales bacterium]